MILADKIINERKKNGWSQEELAEQLSVSRQSVSKWEGAQSVPDIQKIIQMSQIFGVSTDYLLKDDAEPEKVEVLPVDTSYSPLRKVTLEEVNEFLEIKKKTTPQVAIGTALCILCPMLLIFLAGLSNSDKFGISQTVAVGVGLLALFACIIAAVTLFILSGQKTAKYSFLHEEEFETQYGVSGMINELMEETQSAYTSSTIIATILCIASPVPIIIAALLEAPDYIVCSTVCILLMMIATAVVLFIIFGTERSSYQMLLQEGEYSKVQKNASKKNEAWKRAYWSVALVIYLAWSFLGNAWGVSWMVWPIAGVAFGAFASIIKAFQA